MKSKSSKRIVYCWKSQTRQDSFTLNAWLFKYVRDYKTKKGFLNLREEMLQVHKKHALSLLWRTL